MPTKTPVAPDTELNFVSRPVIDFSPIEEVDTTGYKLRVRWFNQDMKACERFIDEFAPMFEEYWDEYSAGRWGPFGFDLGRFIMDWAQANYILIDVVAPDGKVVGFFLAQWARLMFSRKFMLHITHAYIRKEHRTVRTFPSLVNRFLDKLAPYLDVELVWTTVDDWMKPIIERGTTVVRSQTLYQVRGV